jgi:hypothetical protein
LRRTERRVSSAGEFSLMRAPLMLIANSGIRNSYAIPAASVTE